MPRRFLLTSHCEHDMLGRYLLIVGYYLGTMRSFVKRLNQSLLLHTP